MLLVCATGTVMTTLLVLLYVGMVSLAPLLCGYAFEAIMFPTIFALSLRGLGTVSYTHLDVYKRQIHIPANVKHWHGAASDGWFAHLAFEVPGEDTSCLLYTSREDILQWWSRQLPTRFE